jgi:hypothetical protein
MKRNTVMQERMRAGPRPGIPAAGRLPWRWIAVVSTVAMLLPAFPRATDVPVASDACAPSETMRAVRTLSRTVALLFEGRPTGDPPSCCPHCSNARPPLDAVTPVL